MAQPEQEKKWLFLMVVVVGGGGGGGGDYDGERDTVTVPNVRHTVQRLTTN